MVDSFVNIVSCLPLELKQLIVVYFLRRAIEPQNVANFIDALVFARPFSDYKVKIHYSTIEIDSICTGRLIYRVFGDLDEFTQFCFVKHADIDVLVPHNNDFVFQALKLKKLTYACPIPTFDRNAWEAKKKMNWLEYFLNFSPPKVVLNVGGNRATRQWWKCLPPDIFSYVTSLEGSLEGHSQLINDIQQILPCFKKLHSISLSIYNTFADFEKLITLSSQIHKIRLIYNGNADYFLSEGPRKLLSFENIEMKFFVLDSPINKSILSLLNNREIICLRIRNTELLSLLSQFSRVNMIYISEMNQEVAIENLALKNSSLKKISLVPMVKKSDFRGLINLNNVHFFQSIDPQSFNSFPETVKVMDIDTLDLLPENIGLYKLPKYLVRLSIDCRCLDYIDGSNCSRLKEIIISGEPIELFEEHNFWKILPSTFDYLKMKNSRSRPLEIVGTKRQGKKLFGVNIGNSLPFCSLDLCEHSLIIISINCSIDDFPLDKTKGLNHGTVRFSNKIKIIGNSQNSSCYVLCKIKDLDNIETIDLNTRSMFVETERDDQFVLFCALKKCT